MQRDPSRGRNPLYEEVRMAAVDIGHVDGILLRRREEEVPRAVGVDMQFHIEHILYVRDLSEPVHA